FVSVAGHYNENRNNNYNNPTLTDLRNITAMRGNALVPTTPTTFPTVVGNFTDAQWDAVNSIVFPKVCRNASGVPVQRTSGSDPSTCTALEERVGLQSQATTNLLGEQINPSNTGNIRGQSRFTLMDGL